ncbi:MAG: hypothetical protein D6805_01165 [Planctomycetota bacterium]|nr:MAG: hypothetical protein D6805_01165 [Planctomycetota bacterium]
MTSVDDLLLGKILVHNNFATSSQLQECIELQNQCKTSKPLGQILLEKGYITQEQLKMVLSLQNRHRQIYSSSSTSKDEENLFGKIVLMKKFAQAGQVEECLKIQKQFKDRSGKYFKLGEILVQKAYLNKFQVHECLLVQNHLKSPLICQLCQQPFQMHVTPEFVKYTCSPCGLVLSIPIGEAIMKEEEISEEQLKLILDLQQENPPSNFDTLDSFIHLEDGVFDKIIQMKKFAKEGKLQQCLKLHRQLLQKDKRFQKLSQILVQKAYFSKFPLGELLAQQENKQPPQCQLCQQPFTIRNQTETVQYHCANCGLVLKLSRAETLKSR